MMNGSDRFNSTGLISLRTVEDALTPIIRPRNGRAVRAERRQEILDRPARGSIRRCGTRGESRVSQRRQLVLEPSNIPTIVLRITAKDGECVERERAKLAAQTGHPCAFWRRAANDGA